MTYEKILAMAAAVAVVGSGIALATPALAAGQNGKPVVVMAPQTEDVVSIRRVSYRDLDLANYEGEKTLNKRVRRAVSQVCYDATGPNPVLAVEFSCRSDSWHRAAPQISLAVQRAKDIAANGYSNIAPVAIAISAGFK